MQGQNGTVCRLPAEVQVGRSDGWLPNDRIRLIDLLRETPALRGFSMYARHDQWAGGVSPLWRLMAPTTSRGQLRRREAGWEGSRRQSRDLRNTNRIGGGAAR